MLVYAFVILYFIGLFIMLLYNNRFLFIFISFGLL